MPKSILTNMVFLILLFNIYSAYKFCELTLPNSSKSDYNFGDKGFLISQPDKNVQHQKINFDNQITSSENGEDSKFVITISLKKFIPKTGMYIRTYKENEPTFIRKLLLINKSPPEITQFISFLK